MAQRTVYVDDYTGKDIDGEPVPTPVKVGGEEWHLDLSPESYEALRAAVEPFVKNATKVGRSKRGKTPSSPHVAPTGSGLTKAERAAVREWSQSSGDVESLSDRGRIPAEHVEAWRAAGSPGA